MAGGCRTPLERTGGQQLVGQATGHDSTPSASTAEPLIEPRLFPVPEPPTPLAADAVTPLAPPDDATSPPHSGSGSQLATFESEATGASESRPPGTVADTWEAPLAAGDPSQADRVVTIDEVLSYTLANHPLLQARKHEVEAARAKVTTAGLRRNPHFVVVTESPLFREASQEMGGRVTLPILTGRKRRLRRAAACTGLRRAELAAERETQLVLEQAATLAVQVLYLQELVELTAEVSQLAEKRSAVTASTPSRQQAELAIASQMAAEIAAADAESSRLSTRTQLAVARRTLARAMGLAPPAQPAVAGELGLDLGQLMTIETVLALARENRPELAEARVAVHESRQQHAVARAEAHPDLEVGPRYRGTFGEDDDRLGVRIDVDLPLFDRNQGVICETAAQVRVNCAQLRVAELETLSDVATAHAELGQLQQQLIYYNERISQLAAKADALLADPAIRRGISDLQELTIRLALAKMRRDRLQLAYRYEQLLTRLQFFLGEPVTSA